MSDWIDRDEVLEEIEDDASNGVYSCFASYKDAQKFKKKIKSINSRAHGKWIDYQDEGYVECPICGSATNCDDNKEDLHYCFSCGAEMKGGEE